MLTTTMIATMIACLSSCGESLAPSPLCSVQRVPVHQFPNQPLAHPGPTGLQVYDTITVELCVDSYPMVLP